ncbi:MAG: glutathione S-transferase N-terminal domain-containing protein [Bauldia litoralis]
MILRFLPHSPYVRKVLAAAHETGQAASLEIETAHVFDPATPLMAENPLGKVPALIRDDGAALYDSTVICEWLDSRHDGPRLFPAAGEDRWTALRRNALGDGLGQAATWNIRERYRPEGERSGPYMAYYDRAIARTLAALDAEAGAPPETGESVDIGDISIACALSYVDLRYPELDWRADWPALGAWADAVFARPSFEATPLGPYDGPLQPPT